MKYCPKCGTALPDEATFCSSCGASSSSAFAAPAVDPFDHTSEFDPQDISDNKVISMLVYLTGWIGILVALLASSTSKYAGFHVRQALKFTVVETLIPIVLLVGAIINIIPFLGWFVYILVALAAAVVYVILFVLKIICFFQICKGQAKEPALLNKLKFLR